MTKIPTYEEARKRILDDDEQTPLDYFIYDNEPRCDPEMKKIFREELRHVLEWATMSIIGTRE